MSSTSNDLFVLAMHSMLASFSRLSWWYSLNLACLNLA